MATNTNTENSSSSTVDEYTDYSCSTAIERLARDVETLLRSWHVDDGSDRHVSISSQTPLLASRLKSKSGASCVSEVHLIRSDQLVWHISNHFHDGRRISCQMDLELALWDGPSRNDNDCSRNGHLPYSLCRPDSLAEMPLDLFLNFSSLFGIGQHISLTPVNTDLSADLLSYLSADILTRHVATTAVPVLASVLSGWLQTALNVAATASHCCLPVFGVWGRYQPPQQQQQQQRVDRDQRIDSDVPPWIQASQKLTLSTTQTTATNKYPRRRGRQPVDGKKNEQYVPPLLTGQLFAEDSTTTFWCSVLPASDIAIANNDVGTTPDPRLSSWGSLLLRHCPDAAVAVWGARHVFVWSKADRKVNNNSSRFNFNSNNALEQHEWRTKSDSQHSFDGNVMTRYRRQCRLFALGLIEEASGASTQDPLWGPPEDPVASIHATLTWSGSPDESGIVQPLLALPLKARSRRMTSSDIHEMEDAMEGIILDPCRPTKFMVQTRYDHGMAQASLATNQRCVLAALIRTATLPAETLMCHLADKFVIDNWDSSAGNLFASSLADEAGASMATHSLVAAMDWTHAAEDMIERCQAEEIVRRVLDGAAPSGFPDKPDGTIAAVPKQEDTPSPLLASAPAGRLLSLLFIEMARVRSPSSMALVWTVFVEELRLKFDSRESLPNMNHVPGLDHPPDATKAKRCFSSSGVFASFSAQVGTEPDPDDFHCLIGQKLQVCLRFLCVVSCILLLCSDTVFFSLLKVFNICLESVGASETPREVEQLEKKRPRMHSPLAPDFSGNQGDDNEIRRHEEFFDAEGEEDDQVIEDDVLFDLECSPRRGAATETRKGARCPVHGSSLVASGDQLYAPYLQRSYPLTDDVIAERQRMLAQQEDTMASAVVQQRLEIAHRLQKPKLLSDMSSFKAANPGSVFQDFISWYGNPVNPLEEYEELKSTEEIHLGVATAGSVLTKIDRAAEAIRVLTQTRDLWSTTWDEARPIPASRQTPLFDATNTAEMTLDYLETLHPGTLLCQVMAVNLAMAYFALVVSANDTMKVDAVKSGLESLRDKVESALRLLSLDATAVIGTIIQKRETSDVPDYAASTETISSCERACAAISQAEMLVSRATSLLHKLPKQYDLVESIMKKSDASTPIELKNGDCRDAVLQSIKLQQERLSKSKTAGTAPRPAIRDYILRNADDLNPHQLCVRYEDRGTLSNTEGKGAVFMALTKYAKH
jgi:hypothetical protein